MVFMLITPPSVSASTSGVRDFWTSIPSSRSDGTPSSRTPRRSSGDGVRTPLMEEAIRSVLMPRIETYRPSPWSFSIERPGTRPSESATVVSGKLPRPSESTTEMMALEARCWLIAPAWAAVEPTTSTLSM
jgi:hypothetical protein